MIKKTVRVVLLFILGGCGGLLLGAETQLPQNKTLNDTAAAAAARRDMSPRESNDGQLFGLHWNNAEPADFVYLVPAHLGGVIFSSAGAAVGWPLKAIYQRCSGSDDLEHYLPPVNTAWQFVGKPGAYLLGSPFWLLKKTFYDGPIALYDLSFGEEENDPTLAPLE